VADADALPALQVGISLLLCGIAFAYMLIEKEPTKEALAFTVVLLVASIPVAIEIVVTATLAMGSRQLSEHGAIVTRLTAIEEMAGMNMLCSDKTGTLTLNKMVIQVGRAEAPGCLAVPRLATKHWEPQALHTFRLPPLALAPAIADARLAPPPLHPALQEDTPCYVPGMNQFELLRLAALAAKWKEPPRDALDTLVRGVQPCAVPVDC
jgi:hypothetical protein